MLVKKIPLIISNETYSKIEDGEYLAHLVKSNKYETVHEAIIEWWHKCKLKEKKYQSMKCIVNMNKQRAIKTLTDLIVKDKQDINDIVMVLNKSLHHRFWKDNLLSIGKLRKLSSNGVTKYENIYLICVKDAEEIEERAPRKPFINTLKVL